MPSSDGGDYFVRVGGPDKGLWRLIVLGDKAIDRRLQIDDAPEDAPFEAALGEDGEEAFHSIDPTRRGGREVEGPAGMAIKPGQDLGVFVGNVVIEDDVNGLFGRHLAFDSVQEAGAGAGVSTQPACFSAKLEF